MPSLSPLSTLRPWRTRDGIRGSVTTACPSAASVGASTIASNTASMNASCPNTATPARAPATIVSGSPIASRRSGTTYSRRSAARSIRDASEKRTTVSVASATQRTDSLPIVGSSQPRTSALATMPPATNTIAGVITDPEKPPRYRRVREDERAQSRRAPSRPTFSLRRCTRADSFARASPWSRTSTRLTICEPDAISMRKGRGTASTQNPSSGLRGESLIRKRDGGTIVAVDRKAGTVLEATRRRTHRRRIRPPPGRDRRGANSSRRGTSPTGSPTAPEQWAYVLCGLFVWFDAVIPIFPGETTLSAASTLAARGDLDLQVVMVAGALGAILGDSSLFWIARKSAAKMQTQLDKALENPKVRAVWDALDRSPGLLIVAGRYVPGMRFAVNASMGLSEHPLPPLPPLVGPRRSPLVGLHVRTRLQGGNDARRLPARFARDLFTDHVRRVGGRLLRRPSQEEKSEDREAGNPFEHPRPGKLSGSPWEDAGRGSPVQAPVVATEPRAVGRAIRTPRSAALAGMAFSILFTVALVLIRAAIPADPEDAGKWLSDSSRRDAVLFALSLVPFAGIGFLWFVGVLRDRVGGAEDRFFATVFLGSGLLFVAMLFVASAVAASLVASVGQKGDSLLSSGSWEVGRRTTYELATVYAMRMAAVFTLATSTILLRTRLAPRWLVASGYAVAILLLVTVGFFPWVELVFPSWVFALSLYVLIAALRRGRVEGP